MSETTMVGSPHCAACKLSSCGAGCRHWHEMATRFRERYEERGERLDILGTRLDESEIAVTATEEVCDSLREQVRAAQKTIEQQAAFIEIKVKARDESRAELQRMLEGLRVILVEARANQGGPDGVDEAWRLGLEFCISRIEALVADGPGQAQDCEGCEHADASLHCTLDAASDVKFPCEETRAASTGADGGDS